MVAAQQNAFPGQISNPGNRLLKIQYSPLVHPCFEAKNSQSQIGPARVFSLGSSLLRSEIDSLTEPAKQRYKRFSFGCDSVSLSSETKPNQNTDFRFPVCQIAQTGKMPFSLCSLFVRWAVSPDLGALFQNVANANPANSANRMVRFQIWPCCNLVVIGVCYCYSCYFGYSKGARFKRNPTITLLCFPNLALISLFCFSGLAVILPFLFCRIWVTHSNLRGLCTEPRSGVSEQDCSILSTAFSALLNFHEYMKKGSGRILPLRSHSIHRPHPVNDNARQDKHPADEIH